MSVKEQDIIVDFLDICDNVFKDKNKLREELTDILQEIKEMESKKENLETNTNLASETREQQIGYCNQMIKQTSDEIIEIRNNKRY